MSRGVTCPKYSLLVLNILIFVAGASILVAGIFLLLGSGFLNLDVVVLLSLIKDGALRYGIKLLLVTCFMIGTGGFVVITAILGLIAAWKKIKCCMILNILLVILCVMLEATTSGLFINLRSDTDEWLEGQLYKQLNNYTGPTSTDEISQGFNKMFMNGRCCGILNKDDFSSNSNAWYQDTGSGNGESVPATCCKGVTSDNIGDYENSACTTTPQDYYTQGCYTVLRDLVVLHSTIVYICCPIAAVMKILSIALSCVLMDKAENRIRAMSDTHPPPYLGIDAVLKTRRGKA